MAEVTTRFPRAQIVSHPQIADGKNGKYLSFIVREDKVNFKILCFDDERVKNPYKKFVEAMEKGNVGKDTYIIIDSELNRYETYALSDDYWSRIGKGKNPSKVYIDTFKMTNWDYLIPLSVHEELKKNNSSIVPQVTPITLHEMGGSIL